MELNKHDLLHVLQVINSCLLIKDDATIKGCLDGVHNLIPFKSAVLCKMSLDEYGGFRIDSVFNHSYPKSWVNTYLENNFGCVDPVLKFACHAGTPFTWDTAFATAPTDPAITRFEQAAFDHGLTQGISYLCQDEHGTGTLLSLAADAPRDTLKRYGAILRHFVPHLHASMEHLSRNNHECISPVLTPRERDVLRWIKEGKSSWETGQILRISERTVKFHVNNLLVKFNAVSRSQALAKAIEYGLI